MINNTGGRVDVVQNITLGSLSGAGNVNLLSTAMGVPHSLTTGVLGNSDTISGVISGVGGSLTKTGPGILTLTNTNTYSGPTLPVSFLKDNILSPFQEVEDGFYGFS